MESKPQIRFDRFEEKIENKIVQDVAYIKQGYPFDSNKYVKKGNFNIITIANVGGDRYIRNVDECSKYAKIPNNIQEYQVLKENDILVSMTGNVGRVSLNRGENNLLNQRVDVVIPKNNINKDYLYYLLSLPRFEEEMIIAGQGAAQSNISNNNIKEYAINICSIQEQNKIASFLIDVDNNLENRKEQLKKLIEIRNIMQVKMFPQGDSLVPEIRFKEFKQEWTKELFGDRFVKLSNNSVKRDFLNYKSGRYKNIHYGDILTKFSSSIDIKDEMVPYINDDIDLKPNSVDFLKTGDVVFADTAEDTTAGKAVEIINNGNYPTLSGLHTYACRPQIDFVNGYLGIMLNTDWFHNQLVPYMQGSKVTGFNYDFLCKVSVIYPSIEEQTKICNYFKSLDYLITCKKLELEKLINIKESLLNKMFV